MTKSSRKHDVFISHASEDKEAVARPLAEALGEAGLDVWYDEFSLAIGDGLRESIDDGLVSSEFGLVILSPAFFNKRWPRRELDGLVALEMSDDSGRRRILPIWHEVKQAQVAAFSPTLAGVLAGNTNEGLRNLVSKIVTAVARGASADPSANPEGRYTRLIRGEKVDVVKLARESETGGLQGYFFLDCHLVGPAVLGLGSDLELVGLTFGAEQMWHLDEGRSYAGGVPLSASRLERCTFDRIGFAATDRFLRRMYYFPSPPA